MHIYINLYLYTPERIIWENRNSPHANYNKMCSGMVRTFSDREHAESVLDV